MNTEGENDNNTSVTTQRTIMVPLFFKVVLVAVVLLVLRTLQLLYSIRRIRQQQQRNPQSLLSSPSPSSTTKPPPLKTLVVLGSGGHTTEMLHLIRNLDPHRYSPMVLVLAQSDTTSLRRVQAYPHPLPFDRATVPTYYIPRSREVGQSYWTSILTTLYSFAFAFWLVGVQVQPDLVLVNGPGTCLPIAISAFVFRLIGWNSSSKTVFVESFCRVTSLSLTGQLLYHVADLFVVCWEELQDHFPRTCLVTSFMSTKSTTTAKEKRKV